MSSPDYASCSRVRLGCPPGPEQLRPVKVKDIVRELEEEGWVQARQVGSHRQFRHPSKAWNGNGAGRMGDELAKGTVGGIVRQAGLARRQR